MSTVETLNAVLDAIMSFFAEDPVFESPRGDAPWGTRFEGRDAVREGLVRRFAGPPTSTTPTIATSTATAAPPSGSTLDEPAPLTLTRREAAD